MLRFLWTSPRPRERTLLSESDLKRPLCRILYLLVFGLLLLGTITALIPFIWGAMSALKTSREIFTFPPRLWPEPAGRPWQWQWENYVTAWRRIRFMRYFGNTLAVIGGVWFFSIVPNALAGYALSKYRFRGHRVLMLLFFSTLLVPFQSILVPLFLTVQKLPLVGVNLMDSRLLNSWLAVMLPAGVNAFNIFVFKSFFDDIPNDLLEAARIDGAGEVRIFAVVIVPLSRSVFAVLTIFAFMGAWNDFLWPYLVVQDQADYTIMLRLFTFSTQADVPYNVLLAALMLASLPPIALFLVFQRQIMQGISLTGLKV
ncbi:MAG: carbohydrate ABC transporter permease [Candidatus Sumerlaeia bacterium]